MYQFKDDPSHHFTLAQYVTDYVLTEIVFRQSGDPANIAEILARASFDEAVRDGFIVKVT
jgi:hypothetical protein